MLLWHSAVTTLPQPSQTKTQLNTLLITKTAAAPLPALLLATPMSRILSTAQAFTNATTEGPCINCVPLACFSTQTSLPAKPPTTMTVRLNALRNSVVTTLPQPSQTKAQLSSLLAIKTAPATLSALLATPISPILPTALAFTNATTGSPCCNSVPVAWCSTQHKVSATGPPPMTVRSHACRENKLRKDVEWGS